MTAKARKLKVILSFTHPANQNGRKLNSLALLGDFEGLSPLKWN